MISSALSARHDWETEWWYYHGHLQHGGRPYGFHAAFFRRRVDDLTIGRVFPVRYAAEHVWFAHFGLTDLAARRFRYGQRRSMFGTAGAACDRYHVWLGDWSASGDDRGHRLRTSFGRLACDLYFTPRKRPVCHKGGDVAAGDSSAPSHWSYTRMQTEGTLSLDGRTQPVVGDAWMDRECLRLTFDERRQGWDWFGMQLADDREVMVYQFRDARGRCCRETHAAVIEPDGTRLALTCDEFRLEPSNRWTSPRTGCDYPVAWTLTIPRFGAELTVRPFMLDHELDTHGSTSLTYWEGPAAVQGVWNGRSTAGRCFAELVGYDQRPAAFDFASRNVSLFGLLTSEYRKWMTRAGTTNAD